MTMKRDLAADVAAKFNRRDSVRPRPRVCVRSGVDAAGTCGACIPILG